VHAASAERNCSFVIILFPSGQADEQDFNRITSYFARSSL
jgi:hypothetical protein